MGSIEVGKPTNLNILEKSPYDVTPMAIKDNDAWGNMLEGRVQKEAAFESGVALAMTEDTEVERASVAHLASLVNHRDKHWLAIRWERGFGRCAI